MASEDLTNLVSEAFFYGYPLVADLDEVVRFTKTGMEACQQRRSISSPTPEPWLIPQTPLSPSTTTRCIRSLSST